MALFLAEISIPYNIAESALEFFLEIVSQNLARPPVYIISNVKSAVYVIFVTCRICGL